MTSADLEAIRCRANSADMAWLPRWVPFDMRSLISEVQHLRGVVKTLNEKAAQHGEAIIAQQRLTVEAKATVRALEAENAALRAQVTAVMDARRIVGWLRADAARTPPGPVSPSRRVEQAYAAKVADTIERGEHRREEER